MAPLSGLAQHRLGRRWNRFANIVVRHGERFYGFSGLRKFKAKFLPVWRTRYCRARRHAPADCADRRDPSDLGGPAPARMSAGAAATRRAQSAGIVRRARMRCASPE
jgi:phosphatidylglycerol lysyltransferase